MRLALYSIPRFILPSSPSYDRCSYHFLVSLNQRFKAY
nr:MAG TPA: hypothetical protein [Caudoviricetes sp.]